MLNRRPNRGWKNNQQQAVLALAASSAVVEPSRVPESRARKSFERDLVLETLAKADGNRTASARLLGFSIRTLRNKIAEYSADGVDVPPPLMCHHPAA
jgi:DNA-binding NtrC family response regulator